MTTERDFPYDPRADVTSLRGLQKLQAVADRGTAGYLHDLWVRLEPTWRAEERSADYGAGGTASFPDDYSAFDDTAPEPGSAARIEWDRKNALVHAAWREFLEGLEAHKIAYRSRTGGELTRDQVAAHRERYARILRRTYGIAFADQKWLAAHDAWQERR